MKIKYINIENYKLIRNMLRMATNHKNKNINKNINNKQDILKALKHIISISSIVPLIYLLFS